MQTNKPQKKTDTPEEKSIDSIDLDQQITQEDQKNKHLDQLQNKHNSQANSNDKDSNQQENNKLKEQITDLTEMNEKLKTTLATMDNDTKRMIRQEKERAQYAVSDFAKSITEITEVFFLAIDSIDKKSLEQNSQFKSFFDGMNITRTSLLNTLKDYKITRVHPLGEPFDRRFHQAVSSETSNKPENTVLKVIKAGYTIQDRLLNPALVIVSKLPEETSQ